MNRYLVRTPLVAAGVAGAVMFSALTAQASVVNTAAAPTAAAQSKAASAPALNIKRAQQIMIRLGLPVGSADGVWGPQSARGACAFRHIAFPSKFPHRGRLTQAEYNVMWKLKDTSLNKIRAHAKRKKTTYMLAQQTCQTMFYVKNGYHQRVFAITTGVRGHSTATGLFSLGLVWPRGWKCSTLYPESCSSHQGPAAVVGRFAKERPYGNMYNMRQFHGNQLLHGSMDIRTYPASHGCVRMKVSEADWLYDNLKARIPFIVDGRY